MSVSLEIASGSFPCDPPLPSRAGVCVPGEPHVLLQLISYDLLLVTEVQPSASVGVILRFRLNGTGCSSPKNAVTPECRQKDAVSLPPPCVAVGPGADVAPVLLQALIVAPILRVRGCWSGCCEASCAVSLVAPAIVDGGVSPSSLPALCVFQSGVSPATRCVPAVSPQKCCVPAICSGGSADFVRSAARHRGVAGVERWRDTSV
jgi:hypothetical protein